VVLEKQNLLPDLFIQSLVQIGHVLHMLALLLVSRAANAQSSEMCLACGLQTKFEPLKYK
jgi:hypothetical protein